MSDSPRHWPAAEIVVLGAVIVTVTAIAVIAAYRHLPDRLDPLAPLDVRAEPAPMVTPFKLAQLRRDPAFCDAALRSSELKVRPVAFLQQRDCTLRDVVHVAPENRVFGHGFHATCPLAVGLALYLRHVVQPAARRHLGSEIAEIRHLGTFSCRPMRNGKSQSEAKRAEAKSAEASEPVMMSEHAAANAIDITGFRTHDGRLIAVGKHWRKQKPLQTAGLSSTPVRSLENLPPEEEAKARFLREVRDGACGIFHAVLGPDYDGLHRSHFHLDMGRSRQCR